MLIVHETANLDTALQSLMKTHRLKTVPDKIRDVYRPFWLGKVLYRGENRSREEVHGTVVFMADARILNWRIIGAYQHQNIENVLDLRDFQVDFVASEQTPPAEAEVLDPILSQSELSTSSRLHSTRRLLARTLKLGKIEFSNEIEYHLVYRPYWEVEFTKKRGGEDVALISRDTLLVRK